MLSEITETEKDTYMESKTKHKISQLIDGEQTGAGIGERRSKGTNFQLQNTYRSHEM